MPSLILDRLTSDYNKSLKNIDVSSNDYLIRLPDELPLVETLYKGVDYYKKLNKPEETSQLSLLIVELRYIFILYYTIYIYYFFIYIYIYMMVVNNL